MPFKCEFCSYGSIRYEQLKSHIYNKHNSEKMSKELLKEMRIVPSLKSKDKKFICNKCGKTFCYPKALLTHEDECIKSEYMDFKQEL